MGWFERKPEQSDSPRQGVSVTPVKRAAPAPAVASRAVDRTTATPVLQVVSPPAGSAGSVAAGNPSSVKDPLAGLTAQLGQPWQGWLGEVVASAMQQDLAVLNLGCGDVAIIGTEKVIHSSHAMTVRNTITNAWNFTIVKELIVSREAMELLNARLATITPLLKDDSHLSVYEDWVRQAVLARASDMHFSTGDGVGKIKLRIYGSIKMWKRCSAQLLLDAIAAAFGQKTKSASATKESFNQAVPVAFMTHQHVNGIQYEGRFNGRPHSRGYAAVMRLLDSEPRLDRIPTLPELGYTPSQIGLIKPAVLTNYGLIIIFGSTGSGKSTSLRTFLTKVMNPEEVQIYTVESPVEYPMADVVQFSLPVDVTKTSAEIQLGFTAVLRDCMRMDPDVCMVAELRDMETTRLASELTQTEHRCFTTCHGGGAVSGLSRLCDEELQLSASTLAGPKFLSASIYQRLVPLLCPKCKLPASDPEHGISPEKQKILRDRFQLDPGTMKVANPDGCPHCKPKVHGLKGNGTLGVTVVAEIMVPTPEIRAAILKRDWGQVEMLWRSQRVSGFGDPDMRGKTAFEVALYKVSQGEVSLHSIEFDFQPIEVYRTYPMQVKQERIA